MSSDFAFSVAVILSSLPHHAQRSVRQPWAAACSVRSGCLLVSILRLARWRAGSPPSNSTPGHYVDLQHGIGGRHVSCG
jgi:hypothetical protein